MIRKAFHASAIVAFFLIFFPLATEQIQPAGGAAILAVSPVPGTSNFFITGNDGFVSLCAPDGLLDRWQLSTLPIRIVSVHPDGNRVAIFESDGFSVNRVSVWDWKAKTRLFAKRFRDSVISLSWSAKGSWLIIGNTSVDGITILDASRGEAEKIFRDSPGIVSLALTGSSESSMITFGPSGVILYTDTATGKERARYSGISDLSNPVLLANNARIAGYDNGSIYEVDATTGKTLSTYTASDPVMATTKTDIKPKWLEKTPEGSWLVRSGSDASSPFAASSPITAACGIDGKIIFGTSNGELYSLTVGAGNDTRIKQILGSTKSFRKIDDIASDGLRAFILSAGTVYTIDAPGYAPTAAFSGTTGNRLAVLDSQLLIWSDRGPCEMTLFSLDGSWSRPLFTAREGIRSLSSLGTQVSFVEGTSVIHVIDTASPTTQFSYSGVGLQDAVLVAPDKLIVSKSSTTKSPKPLLVISISTGETAPLPYAADLCYGLRLADEKRRILSGFFVSSGETSKTDLVTIAVNLSSIPSSVFKTEISYADEDLSASAFPSDGTLFTNIGKGPFLALSLGSARQFQFDRVNALPVRIALLEQYVLTLNSDGSIAWYSRSGGQAIQGQPFNP